MRIVSYSEDNLISKAELFDEDAVVIRQRDDYFKSRVRKKFVTLSDKELVDMVTLLNTLNNQGILSIDNMRLVYDTTNKKDISIEDMCSGEKLYVVSYLAKLGKIKLIIFYNTIMLEKYELSRYFDIFKNDGITIVTKYSMTDRACRQLLSSVREGPC